MMSVMRERTLLVRLLLLEIALDAVIDAGHLVHEEIVTRVAALRGQLDATTVEDELLAGETGLAQQLELSIRQARARRAQVSHAAESREPRATDWSTLADAYEALALLQIVDQAMYERHDAIGRL